LYRWFPVLLLTHGLCSFAQQTVAVPENPLTLLDALRSTLGKDPNVQLQVENIHFNQGALRIASGQFDTVLQAGTQQGHTVTPLTGAQRLSALLAGIPTANLSSNTASFDFGAQKQFRNGVSVGPSMQVNRTADNLATRLGLNTASWGVQVGVPLLRGLGRAVVAAQETSARYTVRASEHDLTQTVAQELANAAQQYWAVVAAEKNLQTARDSEEWGRKYRADVQTLIDADRVPRAEINQLNANVASRTANRLNATANFLTTRQNLALAIGLTADEMTSFPKTTEALPDWQAGTLPELTPQLTSNFVAHALERRADVKAAGERVKAAAVLLPAASDQARPQLNLSVNAGYAGFLEGTDYYRIFGAPFKNPGGPSASASLQFVFPPRRDSAFGAIAESNANYRQALITRTNVARTIASNVVSSMVNLVNAVQALQQSKQAVAAYQLAIVAEQEKFRMGLTSLVNVLTTEDNLIAATNSETAAHLAYANAIAALRFWTGTIVDSGSSSQQLQSRTFSSPPFDWEQR
jgi:outer membrane protein